ncbi:hypothetical protein [Halanaerobium sp. ST460_2HS_T2]|uniref:hypothetical protein n=1 Tax=Halanaerobium sp. ST460_2HS_T2 TaxID=2183914 RepID=UPI000DF2516A|nr:hypothetical protein [Halanaerobium sp. ST460_2HS_T2]RCW49339.1 hypothetical protein DFR80_1595 [Halanaerobium sp. ST460_2HS_T2]
MTKNFQVVQGVSVPNLNDIYESYSITTINNYSKIIVNVSAENITDLFLCLVELITLPGFLVLEHGTNQKVEQKLRKKKYDPLHKDVFYLDGLTLVDLKHIFSEYKELLVNDGEINFGFGSHEKTEEIYIGPYKVFYIYCENTRKFEDLLQHNNIKKVDKVKTVWSNFSKKTPGRREVIEVNGINIYEMIKKLKQQGLYLAERRED